MDKLSETFVLHSVMVIVFGVAAIAAIFLGLPVWLHWWDVVKEYWGMK